LVAIKETGLLYYKDICLGKVEIIGPDNVSIASFEADKKKYIHELISESINVLKAKYEYLVVEGSGSPFIVEPENDIANHLALNNIKGPIIGCMKMNCDDYKEKGFQLSEKLKETYGQRYSGMIANEIESTNEVSEFCIGNVNVLNPNVTFQDRWNSIADDLQNSTILVSLLGLKK